MEEQKQKPMNTEETILWDGIVLAAVSRGANGWDASSWADAIIESRRKPKDA